MPLNPSASEPANRPSTAGPASAPAGAAATAAAGAATAATESLAPPRLREIVVGYDIRRWPIYVPRSSEESLPGWLARAAARYGISPADVLDELGITLRPQRQVRLAELLAEHADEVNARLGMTAADRGAYISSVGMAMDQQDQRYRQRHTRRRRAPRLLGSRFCPHCLAESPHWQDIWTHPLVVCCPRHRVLLLARRLRCGAEPFRLPTWLTFVGDPMACTGFHPSWDSNEQRYRPRCLASFPHATTRLAEPGLLTAQQWLFELAVDAEAALETVIEPAAETACEAAQAASRGAGPNRHSRTASAVAAGVYTSAEIAYEAALELINTVVAELTPRIRTGEEDQEIGGYALQVVHEILTEPSLDRAAQQALRRHALGENGGLVPLGPRSAVGRRYRKPLVTGLGLSRFRGRTTLGGELTLRMGDVLPSYPHEWTTTTTTGDRPDHPDRTGSRDSSGPPARVHPHPQRQRPPLPLAWIPQQLWPGAFGDFEADPLFGLDTPSGRGSPRWHWPGTAPNGPGGSSPPTSACRRPAPVWARGSGEASTAAAGGATTSPASAGSTTGCTRIRHRSTTNADA